MYKVISSNSKGNAVLYHDSILIDCGMPFSKIKPYLHKLQLILLSHQHLDHFNIKTLKKIQFERPGLRIGCGKHMLNLLNGIRNVDVYEIGEWYDYDQFKLSPIKLYHDCTNVGYRIFKEDHKLIHATDTAHLNGIEAKNYDLYAIEFNYDEETIYDIIAEKEAKGEFAYEKGAINTHLSEQQARDFIFKNKGEKYEVLRLHESTRYEQA